MIEVQYLGRLGNNLFQYCFGRILAEELGYELDVEPILGFPHTKKKIKGKKYSHPEQILTGQVQDLEKILKDHSKRKIVVKGYFQRYEYYQKYRDKIRNDWLICSTPKVKVHSQDIVLCVRRGDYVPKHALPFSFYSEALSRVKHRRVFICTDEPNDPFIILLKLRYRATVIQTDPLKNFAFIRSFKKIIISTSTFCWWAAFLSDATEIYAPLPVRGFWSPHYRINLQIHDEDRYTFLPCKGPYEKNALEEIVAVIQQISAANFQTRQNIKRKLGIKNIWPLQLERKSLPD